MKPFSLAWAAAPVWALPLLVACGGGANDASNAAANAASGAAATSASATATQAASGASGAASGAAPAGPPVSVSTVPARQRNMDVTIDLTGTVVPLANVDLKPQISASVLQVHVREGQSVKKGDLLFTLDSRADTANVARQVAQMAKDEASLADAKRQLTRNQELVAQGFVSQGAIDASRTQVEAQTAVVAADKAAIDAARITLGQARITAPQAGRVGTVNIFPGSVVKANETTLLTITQLDPVDVAFALPQRYLGEALAALQAGGTKVAASMPDRPGALQGRLQFIDNAVDAASGTVKVKARFPNPQNTLWPGAYVKLALTVRTLKDAVVVPQAAIVQSPRGTVVFSVVGGKAVPRPVQVLHAQGEDAAVNGLKPGEKVVLEGRQNLRPGSAVVERARPPGGRASGAKPGEAGTPAGPASGAPAAKVNPNAGVGLTAPGSAPAPAPAAAASANRRAASS